MNLHLSPRSAQLPLPHNHARYDNDGNLLTKTSYAENQTDATPTYATGSVTINGTAECLNGYCKTGTISVTVDGYRVSVNYGNSSDTSDSLASSLASQLNNSSSPVTASARSNVIYLTSKATGPSANYSLSASWSGTGKFTATASGSTLTGGANPPTVTATFSYDALNRVLSKTYSDGTPTATYGYDGVPPSGCSPSLAITNGIYRRTGMCDATGMEAWSYDPMGRVVIDQRTTSGITKTSNYLYYPYVDGSIYQVTYPSGRVITYETGGAGLPLYAEDQTNNINYATNAHYTPAGALAYLQNGSNLYATYIYNDRLQPCWMYSTTGTALPWNTTLCSTADPGLGNILDLQYNFNLGVSDNGNVVGITNKRNSARTQSFAYDSLNRLYTAETQGTSGSNCFGFQFTADPWANLTATSVLSSYTSCSNTTPYAFSITVNGNNQVSTTGFSYDAPGNVMKDGINSYVWNGEGQVTSTAGVTYSYDGDGKRVEKSGGTIYWYGMNGDALDETDLSGSTTNSSFSEYVFFGGKRIARRDSSGNVFYYFADHLGSSREMVQAGQTSPCYDADFPPFGQEVDYTSSCGSHYKFTGKERDSESGLDNFGARYDSSSLGRFMSPDPSGQDAANPAYPQTWNLYSYVRNNPLNATDPDGLDCIYTSDQSSSSVTVSIVRGDCISDTDNGVYVNGTVNANSLTYNGTDLGYSFSNSEDQTGGAGVLSLGQPPSSNSDTHDPLLLAVARGTQMSRPIVEPAFWLTMGFVSMGMPMLEGTLPETTLTGGLGLGAAAAGHPSAPLPTNPAQAPGPGWQWRGSGSPGSSQGSWYNPSTDESLHPDLQHAGPQGPHWDYTNPAGQQFRVYPDGTSIPKQ